ncbi:MAG: UDP-phosphate galactose phosphotransferase [Myxococcaceae bacterium]|nr:UDP-phosphate galactose phosphotransferase [Myxococcaceae bacterium]
MDQPPVIAATCEPHAAYRSRRVARALRLLRRARVRMVLLGTGLGPSVRRSVDLVLTGVGLVCLLPLFLLAALAIKLDSKGPLFFAQERIAENGRRFRMWKFRTMVVDADALKDQLSKQCARANDGVRFKMVRDPRVTRVGAVLRKFSIDELPQLFNVFRGDMTLLGPRPAVWREVARYDNRALRRLEVKPGLTCLWQVSGRSDLSFDQQISLDLHYVDRTRPLEELRIVLQTIPAVLTGRGAY